MCQDLNLLTGYFYLRALLVWIQLKWTHAFFVEPPYQSLGCSINLSPFISSLPLLIYISKSIKNELRMFKFHFLILCPLNLMLNINKKWFTHAGYSHKELFILYGSTQIVILLTNFFIILNQQMVRQLCIIMVGIFIFLQPYLTFIQSFHDCDFLFLFGNHQVSLGTLFF